MITLTGRVTHDGKTYEPGQNIAKINENQARRLVNLGVAYFIGEKSTLSEEVSSIEYELNLLEYNDLKIVAKEVGINFKGNISKKELIDLIINENKADEVLKLTEVEA